MSIILLQKNISPFRDMFFNLPLLVSNQLERPPASMVFLHPSMAL